MTYLLQPLLAALLTALLIELLRLPARRIGLVDRPGGRKRHKDIVPLTGGLAIGGATLAALAPSAHLLGDYFALLAGVALLGSVGMLDDLGEVTARTKFAAQTTAAVLMTSWGDHFLITLGDILALDRGPLLLGNWGIPLTLFATLAVVNGMNMLDGLDGLAGGLALGILSYFALFAWLGADPVALKLLLVLIGALLGFLAFNAPTPLRGKRRVFMGDAGSLALGLIIVWFSIELSQPGETMAAPVPPVVLLWVVGVLLFDVFTVTVRRMLRRRSPVVPDRAHLHHLLMRRGCTPRQATALIIGANLLLGAAGIGGWKLGFSDTALFGAFMLLGLVYLALFLYPARFLRIRKHLDDRDRSPADPRPAPATLGDKR